MLGEWAPISPVSGKIDAVEWKIPVAEIAGPRIEIDKSELVALPAAKPDDRTDADLTAETSGQSTQTVPVPEEKPSAPEPRIVRMAKTGKSALLPVEPPQPDDPGVVDSTSEDSDELQSNAR